MNEFNDTSISNMTCVKPVTAVGSIHSRCSFDSGKLEWTSGQLGQWNLLLAQPITASPKSLYITRKSDDPWYYMFAI